MAHENDWIADQHENEPKSWSSKTWPGNIPQYGTHVWSIGDDIYYSNGSSSKQYVLNKTNLTWETKTWSGLYYIYGSKIWTDGDDYFYSNAEDGEQYVLDQNTSRWNFMMWSGFAPSDGAYVWTDGENIYCSKGSAQYVLDKSTSTWSEKTWNGLTSFDGSGIWRCGDYVFYSVGNVLRFIQYILDRTTSTWYTKSWNNSGYLNGKNVWTDGENIYSSNDQNDQRILNREIVSSVPYRSNFPEMIESVDLHDKWVSDVIEDQPDVWIEKDWGELVPLWGSGIWSDGDNLYYLGGNRSYVYNKSEKIWENKTWYGLDSIPESERTGSQIWSDGENIYYSDYRKQFVLDKATSTWTAKTWNGRTDFYGSNVWTDGENVYLSGGNANYQYVLNKATSTWEAKTWSGYQNIIAGHVWFDGDNIYYSQSSNQYILEKATSTWVSKTWNGITPSNGGSIWNRNGKIYYSDGANQLVLDSETSTWSRQTWSGLTLIYKNGIWSDGEEIYYSYSGNQCMLTDIKITATPYRLDFPELKASKNIEDEWITHDIPDPSIEGLRFLKLSYNLTVNWEGGGTNNISVSTDIPEAFKRSDHLYISSSSAYHQVWMVINTEIAQCPYQCRMTFSSSASELIESLNFIAPQFYVYRTRTASKLLTFTPSTLEEDLYAETRKNAELADDQKYISTPYNYAIEPRVTFNHGSGGAFPTTPGTLNVAIEVIFAFTAGQSDRYNDLLSRYPNHVTPFEYLKNAIPYRSRFPELIESIDISDKWLISDDIPFRLDFPKLIESSGNPKHLPSSFTFKGKESSEFGSVEILPLCLKHEQKTDFINFISGSPYVMETSVFRSKVITITIGLKDTSPENIDKINSWLIGTGKLIFSHDPNRYYIATCNNALTGTRVITLGKLTVQFNVMPFKYDNRESENFESVSISGNTAEISYAGNYPAETVYKIYGDGTIQINDVEIHDVTDFCIIDIKAKKVYGNTNNVILDHTYGNIFDLQLMPGINQFTFSSNVTALEIKKNTRWY